MAPERKLIPGKRLRSKRAVTISADDVTIALTPDSDDGMEEEEDDDVSLGDLMSKFMTDPEELAVVNAKLELMRTCDREGVSLYDHLCDMLTEVLTNQTHEILPRTIALEEMSRRMKLERLKSDVIVQEDKKPNISLIKETWELFKTIGHEIPDANPKRPPTCSGRQYYGGTGRTNMNKSRDSGKVQDRSREENSPTPNNTASASPEDKLAILPDMMRQCDMFNTAGFGLPSMEYTKLVLAMRELVLEQPMKSIRFWGKILGTHGNYYVVETQLCDEEYEEDKDDIMDGVDDNGKKRDTGNGDGVHDDTALNDDESIYGNSNSASDIIPLPAYKQPITIPMEEPGLGVNMAVYFVCTQPGLPWQRLPYVTPQQIAIARQVTSLFTGDLQHAHATYPPFPGNEAGYLRAQIARITSSTCISPIGYFKFDEEVEEEEERAETQRESCIIDEEFEGLSRHDLSDPSLQYWAHHINYILPQGRTTWFDPLSHPRGRGEGEDEEDEEGEEERLDDDDVEPEIPLTLLVPISEDVHIGPSPPWIARMASQFVPEHSPVALISVKWPGAVTVADQGGKFYENLYIGWGLKCVGENFDPAIPGEPVSEFPTGPEVVEQEDPTPEEEAAMKAVMKEQEELLMDRAVEEEEEEEEEEIEEEIYE